MYASRMRLCSSCLTVPSKRGLIFCGLYDTFRFGTPSCRVEYLCMCSDKIPKSRRAHCELRVGGKTQASGRLAWTTKFSTRFRGSQNSSGVWYLSYSTEITPFVLELGNFCCPLLWRTAKAKWHGTERTRIEVSRDTKREKRNGNTKGQQPGDWKMLLLDCTAAPKPKVDGEQQPVSTTRDGRKQG